MDLVLLCKSLLLVEEFELLCIESWPGESHGSAVVLSSSPVRLCPPCAGMLKLNIDAAVRSSSGFVGFGMVVRNSNGWMLSSSAQFYRADLSTVLAEATTLLRGLQFMATTRWTVGVAESDCLVLSNGVTAVKHFYGNESNFVTAVKLVHVELNSFLKSNGLTAVKLIHEVFNSFLKVTIELVRERVQLCDDYRTRSWGIEFLLEGYR
ncbi:hypothetical protein ACOSP7_031926 [Xanthoceras sorbifolium]